MDVQLDVQPDDMNVSIHEFIPRTVARRSALSIITHGNPPQPLYLDVFVHINSIMYTYWICCRCALDNNSHEELLSHELNFCGDTRLRCKQEQCDRCGEYPGTIPVRRQYSQLEVRR